MPKNARKQKPLEELNFREDPFLLDDPGGSPLEWLEQSLPTLHEAIRHAAEGDPWECSQPAPEADELTERRRRKFASLSLYLDIKQGDSVA